MLLCEVELHTQLPSLLSQDNTICNESWFLPRRICSHLRIFTPQLLILPFWSRLRVSILNRRGRSKRVDAIMRCCSVGSPPSDAPNAVVWMLNCAGGSARRCSSCVAVKPLYCEGLRDRLSSITIGSSVG